LKGRCLRIFILFFSSLPFCLPVYGTRLEANMETWEFISWFDMADHQIQRVSLKVPSNSVEGPLYFRDIPKPEEAIWSRSTASAHTALGTGLQSSQHKMIWVNKLHTFNEPSNKPSCEHQERTDHRHNTDLTPCSPNCPSCLFMDLNYIFS
jgi:hypothetical protein